MKHLITTFLLFGAAHVSFGGVYELKFSRVSAMGDAETCKAFAEEVAHELTAQSGAGIIEHGCREDSVIKRALSAVVIYQSPNRLKVLSSYTASVYSAAFYSSRAQCEQRLALQKDLFTQATSLKPLTAYCMLDVGSPNTWVTRVDGLGESEVTPGSAGLRIWGSIADGKSLLAKYETAAKAHGITVFEGGVSGGFGKQIVIRYYARTPYTLHDYDSMKYESEAACATASSVVQDILVTAEKPVVVFCEKDGSNTKTATLHVTAFEDLLKPKSLFKVTPLTTEFLSFQACQSASQNLQSSDDIFGTVCAGVGKAFVMHVFSRP